MAALMRQVLTGPAQTDFLVFAHTSSAALQSALLRTFATTLGRDCEDLHLGLIERTESGNQATCSSWDGCGLVAGETPNLSATFDDVLTGQAQTRKRELTNGLQALLASQNGSQEHRPKHWEMTRVDARTAFAGLSCTTLQKGSSVVGVSPPSTRPWQALWRRQYETSSGDKIDLPTTLNRRGKKLVRRREERTDDGDEALLADEEGMARVGLKGLRWMRQLANTPRRRQEGMLEELYKDMHNPLSSNYLLWAAAAEGEKEDQRMMGKEEKRLDMDADGDDVVERAFEMQIIDINRTNKATKGGRVMSMTAMVVVGNQDGVIGYDTGKALEPEIAVDKAYHRAVKNLLFVPRYRGHTIYHPVEVKYGQTKVRMWPAEDGVNIVASKILGGIADLAGIRNLKSKIIGSRHPQNVVKAVFKAFASIQTPSDIAQQFNRPVVEVRNMPFREPVSESLTGGDGNQNRVTPDTEMSRSVAHANS